jgi:SAM-dependent methyltransferase
MSLVARFLEQPWVYRLWQMPFAGAKLEPVLRHNRLDSVRRVLDVGCGPGTSAPYFEHCDYTGIDINPKYVEFARRRYRGAFVVGDVTELRDQGERYDFILVNSVLHHLSDAETRGLLATLRAMVSDGGHLHVLELVTPPGPGAARFLADHDRGAYNRSVDEWRALFDGLFEVRVAAPYALTGAGTILWHMVYLKAAVRT